MRHVEDRPEGTIFESWRQRACDARNKLINTWRKECESATREGRSVICRPKFNEDLYKEFRQVFLFKAFYFKCAYCEVIHVDGYALQVEHYRPKGAVTEGRSEIDHPGYFWLAYEWWNLVPSCAHCNTNHTDPCGGSHPGKKNEFPVNGARIIEPSGDPENWRADLDNEQALLLNPYFDLPEDHIDFDPETGAAIPKTSQGAATIEICDLSRPSLRDKRLRLAEFGLRGLLLDIVELRKDINEAAPPSGELSLWLRSKILDRFKIVNERLGLPDIEGE